MRDIKIESSKIARKTKYKKDKNNKKIKHQERGVTITSLVVTIIVLLILSGITIKFALDDNGIIKQSRLASEKYQNKALQEQLALNQAEKEITEAANNASSVSSGNQTTGGGTSGGSSGSTENTDELKRQIEDLQSEVDRLTAQIQKEQEEKAQLQQQVNDLNKQLNEANNTITDLKNQIKEKDNKISDLTKEKGDLESQINTLKSKQATENATEAQVLAGATFSTSAGVDLTGTMVNHSAITTAVSVGSDGNRVYLRTTQGAYLTNATTGYPEVCATISDVNNATGYKYTQAQYDANYNNGYSAGKSASSVTIKSLYLGTGSRVDDEFSQYRHGYHFRNVSSIPNFASMKHGVDFFIETTGSSGQSDVGLGINYVSHSATELVLASSNGVSSLSATIYYIVK